MRGWGLGLGVGGQGWCFFESGNWEATTALASTCDCLPSKTKPQTPNQIKWHQPPKVAELLSQLPADMDIEALVATTIMGDPGESRVTAGQLLSCVQCCQRAFAASKSSPALHPPSVRSLTHPSIQPLHTQHAHPSMPPRNPPQKTHPKPTAVGTDNALVVSGACGISASGAAGASKRRAAAGFNADRGERGVGVGDGGGMRRSGVGGGSGKLLSGGGGGGVGSGRFAGVRSSRGGGRHQVVEDDEGSELV